VVSISILMAYHTTFVVHERGKMKLHLHKKVKCTNCKGKGSTGSGYGYGYDVTFKCKKCSGKGYYEQIKPISIKDLKSLLDKV